MPVSVRSISINTELYLRQTYAKILAQKKGTNFRPSPFMLHWHSELCLDKHDTNVLKNATHPKVRYETTNT